MDLKSIYNEIKRSVAEGISFDILKKRYPLMTRNLYVKLGGRIKRTRFKKNSPLIRAIIGSSESEAIERGHPDHDFLIGSLLGDGHIEVISDNEYTQTSLYRTGHCWAQAGYVKLIYEILKPFSSALTVKSPNRGMQDYHVHFTTISSRHFNRYRNLFYQHSVDIGHKKKDVLNEDIIDHLSWRSLAFWIMDDGKHRGGKYCFSLPIGFQNHYTDDRAKRFTEALSEHFNLRFHWGKEKTAYQLYLLKESVQVVRSKILPYIWPDFFYKFRCLSQECGEVYRSKRWFKEWEASRRKISHPFFDHYAIQDYVNDKDSHSRERLRRVLLSEAALRFSSSRFSSSDIDFYDFRDWRGCKKLVEEFLDRLPCEGEP